MYQSLEATLRQFCLLVLPGAKSSQIECTLHISRFELGSLSYEALSYEWGNPNAPVNDIMLNEQKFQIRENLYYAQLHLRSETEARTLWVDAICINQNDILERNHQVGMMRHIYTGAAKVLVWIGCAPTEFKYYCDLSKQECSSSYGLDIDADFDLGQLDSEEDDWEIWDELWDGTTSIQCDPWEELAILMEQSYWTRIWIVQEYVLAAAITVHCGSETVDGKALELALNHIVHSKPEGHSNFPVHLTEYIERISHRVGSKIIERRRDSRRTLAELLDTTKSSRCHDPHDRIYGVLGVAADIQGDSIPIDYKGSIFKMKMDVAWFFEQYSSASRAYVSNICSLLEEIFANYPDTES
ncbi:hypothetical protein G7Y89_g3847 [Cudoniella acicularis]|uniref:Heterokaryon incompatibility domain-containing protein n=1 Tax=Cudoniella acicularis TaxID=354080 RepID=A0A8H4RRY0_9HELO|nr:hypothetical protein G7Y89_g3847 [Cudoniella acicularis]